jgi:hypothetical protein
VGIDPGKYSKKLCSSIGQLVASNEDYYVSNVTALMWDAWAMDQE